MYENIQSPPPPHTGKLRHVENGQNLLVLFILSVISGITMNVAVAVFKFSDSPQISWSNKLSIESEIKAMLNN